MKQVKKWTRPTCHPDKKHYARGLCGPCYKQARRRGEISPLPRPKPREDSTRTEALRNYDRSYARSYARRAEQAEIARLPRKTSWACGVPFLLTVRELAAILYRSPSRTIDLIRKIFVPMGGAKKLRGRWMVSSWAVLRMLGMDEERCPNCGRLWDDRANIEEVSKVLAELEESRYRPRSLPDGLGALEQAHAGLSPDTTPDTADPPKPAPPTFKPSRQKPG